ncbi:MAG: ABC transporter permease subunit [Eubacteriales bacterium]|nr:ABC transporter permease subunit [Eubacteriales bacterium]
MENLTGVNKKPGKKKIGAVLKRCWPFYVMMAPGLIYLIINNYLPMLGLVVAFKKIDYRLGIFKSPWVGLSNFEYLFKTSDAWIITRNTICYNFVFIVLGTVVSVAVAILLNEIRGIKKKKAYQTIILIPYLISTVVISYLVYAFLSAESGFINNGILQKLGMAPVAWYGEKKYWPFILVIVQLWKSFGYNCIIYYATILGIDGTLYEAAVMDGASRWHRIKDIILPSLKTTIITLTLMSIGRIFYSDFGLFYQVPMNSGPLFDVTNTIDTYVYRGLLQLNDVGRASAAGFYQSMVGFAVVLIANFIVRKTEKESALF